jgi:hypothetical protein
LILIKATVPMYNVQQFQNPIQQDINFGGQIQQQTHKPLEINFSSITSNQNRSQDQFYDNFQSSYFNMQAPSLQTFETYPQVQTQINISGMPPLTVNTTKIDLNQ